MVFFISSLGKFLHGGYFTALLTLLILCLMLIWHRGTKLEKKFRTTLNMREYIETLRQLHEDESLPLIANNLVYLVKEQNVEEIDRDILFSIVDKDAKRANAYWFVNINILETPGEMNYEVETYGTDFIFRVKINLGFKCGQQINVYLRQIVQDLQASGELPEQDRRHSIYRKAPVGNFKFGFIHKSVPTKTTLLSALDIKLLSAKYKIREWAGSKVSWYGLNTASLIIETVPLIISPAENEKRITRKTKS